MFKNTAHDPARTAPTGVANNQAAPLTVLLVDDNQTFLTAIRQFLDRLGHVRIVAQALDGMSALAKWRQHRPALVLLDIAMPGMNGLELARALLQEATPPQLVFLSLHDNREYRAAARELGADFVSKADFVTELLPLLARKTSSLPAHDRACRCNGASDAPGRSG